MMKQAIVLLTVLAAVLVAGFSAPGQQSAAKNVTFTYRPKPGTLFEVIEERRETEGGNMSGIVSRADTFDLFGLERETVSKTRINSQWRVLDPDEKGNSVIDITYKYIRVGRTIGRVVSPIARFIPVEAGVVIVWDTRDSVWASNPMYASAAALPPGEPRDKLMAMFRQLEAVRTALANYLIDRTFRIVVDKQGRVVDVQGMDVLLDGYRTELARLKPDIETRAKQDAMVNAFLGDDSVRQALTSSILLYFPAAPVPIGGKWSDTFDFDMVGTKVPLKRDFTLVKKSDYSERFDVNCKIAIEVVSPVASKNVEIKGRFDLTAEVDPSTGTYYERKQTGNLEVRKAGSDAGLPPIAFVRSSQNVTSNDIASRDAKDRSLWLFYGGYSDFTILLGEKWTRLEPNPNSPHEGIFEEQRTGMRIDYAITERKVGGVMLKVEDDRRFIETQMRAGAEIADVAIAELKSYKSGPVEWVRFSLDLKYRSGKEEHYIVQDGFTAASIYRFMLMLPPDNPPAKRTEAARLLDTIDVRRQE